MKHYSESFNKRSRLIIAPEIDAGRRGRLGPPDGATLRDRIVDALRVQQDSYPCFDWVFPPPVFPKSRGPRRAEALFTYPSVVPGTYSVYLHVPYCKTLCSFCYYTVLPGRGHDEKSTYVDYLVREMAMYRACLQGQQCESVYVGGGTPTSLDDAQLVRLFHAIRDTFDLASDAEVSIESAPDTLPRDKVALLKSLGVNRLSYGIQSLDERLLASMNRYYTVTGAMKELEAALPLIGNINVDTIYGFENEPADALSRTLTTFEQLGIPCLTIYSLDTQRSVRKNVWLGPPRDALFYQKIAIYQEAVERLASLGYEALFQNTFAKPGRGSYRHQLRRWENVSLVALGVGSMGYAPRRPYQNHGTTGAYFKRLDAGELPIETMDALTPEMELLRQVITQLRFARVNLRGIHAKYGVDVRIVFGDLLRVLGELGLLERDGDEIVLSKTSAPYNNVLPMLFAPDSFKEDLLGLPADYLAAMPIPLVLTRIGATQSSSLAMGPATAGATGVEPETAGRLAPDGSCPVVDDGHRA
jgi:oxygen-independent coproporphyrinogen III oxidase